jgi:hypothetical protein
MKIYNLQLLLLLSLFNLSLFAQTKDTEIQKTRVQSNIYASKAGISGQDVFPMSHQAKDINGLSEMNPVTSQASHIKYSSFGKNTNPDSLHVYRWDYSINDFYLDIRTFYEFNDINLLTFSISYQWNKDSLHWKKFSQLIRNYDENNNLIEQISYYNFSDNPDDWSNISRAVFEYDENSNLIKRVRYTGLDQYWRKNNYEYNENGVLIMEEELVFQSNSNEWKGDWKNIYIFDEFDLLQEEINFWWWNTVNNWSEERKKYYYYDDGNNNTETVWYYRTNVYDENLYKYLRFTYEYDQNTNLLEEIKYYYISYVDSWREATRITNDFDTDGNVIETVFHVFRDDHPENWFATETENFEYNSFGMNTFHLKTSRVPYEEEWQNISKSYFEYDEQQKPLIQTSYYWSHIENEWAGSGKIILTYDELYRLEKYEYFTWDMVNKDWILNYYYITFYSGTLYIPQDPFFNAVNIFPNPAKDKLNISGLTHESIISVFDLNGRLLIREKSSSESNIIDVSNFQSSIYILEVRNGNTVQSIKFLKQ